MGGRSRTPGYSSQLSVQYIGLGAVAGCVDVNVTVGGESCPHEFRGDVVICPLSSSLQLGKDGTPLQVGDLLLLLPWETGAQTHTGWP